MVDECEKDFKMVAPDIDELIGYLDQELFNTVASTPAIERAIEPLVDLLKPLAPLKDVYDEVKELWIRIPRGESCDNDYDYPEETVWYRLLLRKGFNYDGSLYYYALSLNNQSVINATIGGRVDLSPEEFEEGAAIKVCELILPAVEESMNLLKDGKYNELVQMQLPYKHRVGVIKRSEIWAVDTEKKKEAFGGLTEDDVIKFKTLIASGINHEDKIGRIKEFTANNFFMACKHGYEAVGENCEGYSPSELYRCFSDGRDEGLTGAFCTYDEDIGIDFDDPKAWDGWYFGRTHRGSGHPWEVYPGVCVYVSDNEFDVEMEYRRGDISEDEYKEKLGNYGYYFVVAAGNRPFESVKFYNALSEAGYPVIVSGGCEGKLIISGESGEEHYAVYRGWMMKPEQYERFYNLLQEKNIKLVTDPVQYRLMHIFPNVYDCVKSDTAKMEVFPLHSQIDVELLKKSFGRFMVKDYVKSVKGTEFPRFFDQSITQEEFDRWIQVFYQYRGDLLTGGICIKEFLDLKRYGERTNEYRVFYINHEIATISRNSGQMDHAPEPPKELLEKYKDLNSPYYTVDYAELEDGSWRIVEAGDGEVSGLSDNQDYEAYFRALYQCFKE